MMNSRRLARLVCLVAALLILGLAGASDGDVTYEPTKRSITKHQVPEWFHDAKFGIFIHWSLSAVPAYAPVSDRPIWEIAALEGVTGQLKFNPYAEWYLNTMQVPGSPTSQYHRENYGDDFSYFDFAPMFNDAIESWRPDEWASLFEEAGARYVALVTKHHDGFLLWPSDHPNPFKPNYHARRDVVGELTEAVRAQGLRMGYYYSGGLDWTFQTVPITDAASYLSNGPITQEYADYVEAHFHELIDKHHPDILWNDICYPPDGDLWRLFAYYYNNVSEGVVNDRWTQFPKALTKVVQTWPTRQIVNAVGDLAMTSSGVSSPDPAHSDFVTPEYKSFDEIKEKKWESTRGIGHSFGYNRMETAEQYLNADEAVRMLIDVVSKNGNLLLNVGPRADGSIPEEQIACLRGIGKWLEANGDAIHGTRPWRVAEGVTKDGVEIRFTQKDGRLYAILMSTPDANEIEIVGVKAAAGTKIFLLSSGDDLDWSEAGGNTRVILPPALPQSPAHVIVFDPAPE